MTSLELGYLRKERPYLHLRSHSEVLMVKTSVSFLEKGTIQPVTGSKVARQV